MDAGHRAGGVVAQGEQLGQERRVQAGQQEGVVRAQVLHQVAADRVPAEGDDRVGVAEGHHVQLARALVVLDDGDRLGRRAVGEQVAGRGVDVDDVGQAGERHAGQPGEVVGQARGEVDELDAGRQQDDGGAVGVQARAVLDDGQQHLPQGAGPAVRRAGDVEDGRGARVEGDLRGGQTDEAVGEAGVAGRVGSGDGAGGGAEIGAGTGIGAGVERGRQDEGVLAVESEGDQVHQQRIDDADECEAVHGTSQLTVLRIICI